MFRAPRRNRVKPPHHPVPSGLRSSRLLVSPFIVFFVFLFVALRAFAGGATLAWDPVTNPAVVGYALYYGPTAGNYTARIDVGNVTSYTVSNLTEGATYHFAVTAYDAAHTESPFSNDVSGTIPYSAPVANFNASTTSGTAPLAMNFTSTSTGMVTTYAWSFGDGGTSTLQNPSHAYTAAGVYTVALTVTGPGGSNTKTNTGYVLVSSNWGRPQRGGGSGGSISIWPRTAAPVSTANPDTRAIELGIKFQSDRDGFITGIRYYKARTNNGTHIGSLWSSDGTLLAQATFNRESRSGWQQVTFANPVPIKANTVYVASYHTSVGRYYSDSGYFTASGVDNAPLHALRDGVSGSNGVYAVGAMPSFPSSGLGGTNYWVDVVFK